MIPIFFEYRTLDSRLTSVNLFQVCEFHFRDDPEQLSGSRAYLSLTTSSGTEHRIYIHLNPLATKIFDIYTHAASMRREIT